MKIICILLVLLYSCQTIDETSSQDTIIDYAAKSIAEKILDNYIDTKKKTIGVATFTKEDLKHKNPNLLGLFLANAVHNEMFNPNRYDLVERIRIDEIIKEFKKSQSGLFSSKGKDKLGLIGVDYLLIGSLQKRKSTIRINTRLVSIKTGKIVSMAKETIPVNAGIENLFDRESLKSFIDRKKLLGLYIMRRDKAMFVSDASQPKIEIKKNNRLVLTINYCEGMKQEVGNYELQNNRIIFYPKYTLWQDDKRKFTVKDYENLSQKLYEFKILGEKKIAAEVDTGCAGSGKIFLKRDEYLRSNAL
ncbi:MAG: FlgO family outer membrane protein [Spirochaetota bacterium]